MADLSALESSVPADDPKLGAALLQASELLDSTDDDPAEVLALAVRALNILEKTDGAGSLSVAKALRLLGSAGRKLRRFDDSFEFLTTAEQILARLKDESLTRTDMFFILAASADLQVEIARTKTAMGQGRESITNLRRALELKSSILEPKCIEIGAAYKELAEAYIAVLEFGKALRLCTTALEIYKVRSGESSLEVAEIRRLLVVVYTGLGQNEAALEENELARAILQDSGSEDEVLGAEIEKGNIQIALGRLFEAVDTLKGVIQKAGKESEARAFVFISMANALCVQEKFADAKQCLEISAGILEKMEADSPAKVAEAYADMSMLYESMAEFEIALSLMKRTLVMLEKVPQEGHLEGSISARMGWLLLLTGRVPQAVPYLQCAAERLKKSFGPKHFGVGFVYKHLGQSYLEMNQPESAVKMLVLAKDIICASFGLHHEDSIDTCQCLANAYGLLGSYDLAMESQKRVVDAWERHGPNAKDEFREAERLLEQLKRKAQGSPSAVFPANTLPLLPEK